MATKEAVKTRTYYRYEIGYTNDPTPHYFADIVEQEFAVGDEIPRYHYTTKAEALRASAAEVAASNSTIGARV